MARIEHTCTNCEHEYIDYLTVFPTWWCKSPNRKRRPGFVEIGYEPKRRCRLFEPKAVE